jgi:predicted O-methyltransferase YrrM
MTDILESGRVIFVDPSMVDDFWKDRKAVEAHFLRHGIRNVRHFLMTTQEFVESPAYVDLDQVDILFIDGYHSHEQARFDYEAFESRLSPQGVVLFHDSVRVRESRMYGPGKEYEHRVRYFIDELKEDRDLQVIDFPLSDGVTLVRKVTAIPPWSGPSPAFLTAAARKGPP